MQVSDSKVPRNEQHDQLVKWTFQNYLYKGIVCLQEAVSSWTEAMQLWHFHHVGPRMDFLYHDNSNHLYYTDIQHLKLIITNRKYYTYPVYINKIWGK